MGLTSFKLGRKDLRGKLSMSRETGFVFSVGCTDVLFDDGDVDGVRRESGLTFGGDHFGRSLEVREIVAGRPTVMSWLYTGT